MSKPDVLLVTCVKTKRDHPCAAKDIYVSTLFGRQRAYAGALGIPWFILSAEYGLVGPDEWVSPYERYLPDTSSAYQSAWGMWVTARLELLSGSLAERVIEVHAGSAYITALRHQLEERGAVVLDPLYGLSMGARLAWYGEASSHVLGDADGDAEIIALLLDESSAILPSSFIATGSAETNRPGLYSWWVDKAGASTLSEGLGLPVGPGLIYAGLAGATRWPSGTRSNSSLWLRIAKMHLAGSHEFSTFRRTLGAVIASANGSTNVNEQELSEWMQEHLKVVAVPFDDRDELGRLEKRVLTALDPPLNLQGMSSNPLRKRLKILRAVVTHGD